MTKYDCKTCRDTGKVEVANGEDDFDTVKCPDCSLDPKDDDIDDADDDSDIDKAVQESDDYDRV